VLSMAQKKHPTQTNRTFKKVTVVFGYGLFVLAILNLIISTVIPWTGLLLSPYPVQKTNVAVQLVSFIFAVVLPPLVGYILGQKMTHRHDRLTHHFNGVLFGIVAYWVSVFTGFVAVDTIQPIRNTFSEPWATVITSWPIVATLVVMSGLAFYYAHNMKQKDSVLHDRVYQFALFAGVVSIPVYEILFLVRYYDVGSLIYDVVVLAAILGCIIISRYAIHRFQPTQKNPLSLSVIAVSVGLITMQLAGEIIALITPWYLTNQIGSAIAGIIAWLLYLLLVVRKA
jgi:hypothetical protein